MRASFESLRSSIARWKSARRVVLGAVVLTGAMTTYAALAMRVSEPCAGTHEVERAYTYSGIGVSLQKDAHGRFRVREVVPGGPADGKLRPGAHLIRVNGDQPATLEDWTRAIRGKPGTAVNLEVAYGRCHGPGPGHEQVALVRDVVRVRY